MDLFSFLSFHFMCVTVMVVTGHSVALSRRSHLFSTMSSLHDVLVYDSYQVRCLGGGVYVVQASWSMEDHGSVRRVSLGGR
jgi:NADPH-dependent 2,4-dienoyl-CoA reductase/sulfur reductase-like enzyme